MTPERKQRTCPSCAEEIQTEAIRCKHCGHLLVGEEWLGHVRAYARLTPAARLQWMQSLTPDQGRRFRQVWKVLGPEAERQAPRTPRATAVHPTPAERSRKRNAQTFGCLVAALVSLLLAIVAVETTGNVGASTILMMVGAVLYFVPFFVAAGRAHHNLGAIFVVNLLLGWTFIGWVIALAMACSAVRSGAIVSPGPR